MGEVGDSGHTDVVTAEAVEGLLGDGDESRVDADGGGLAVLGAGGLAQLDDSLVGVIVGEGGQVHQGQCLLGDGLEIAAAFSFCARHGVFRFLSRGCVLGLTSQTMQKSKV